MEPITLPKIENKTVDIGNGCHHLCQFIGMERTLNHALIIVPSNGAPTLISSLLHLNISIGENTFVQTSKSAPTTNAVGYMAKKATNNELENNSKNLSFSEIFAKRQKNNITKAKTRVIHNEFKIVTNCFLDDAFLL